VDTESSLCQGTYRKAVDLDEYRNTPTISHKKEMATNAIQQRCCKKHRSTDWQLVCKNVVEC
jgi:hypothetical protein